MATRMAMPPLIVMLPNIAMPLAALRSFPTIPSQTPMSPRETKDRYLTALRLLSVPTKVKRRPCHARIARAILPVNIRTACEIPSRIVDAKQDTKLPDQPLRL